MKKQSLAHVPPMVTTALQETASRLAGPDLDVITAAVWAFRKQDEAIRQYIVADVWLRDLAGSEAPRVNRRHKTFTEKVYALATHCYSALRHWLAQHGPGRARATERQVLPHARIRGRTLLVRHLPARSVT